MVQADSRLGLLPHGGCVDSLSVSLYLSGGLILSQVSCLFIPLSPSLDCVHVS